MYLFQDRISSSNSYVILSVIEQYRISMQCFTTFEFVLKSCSSACITAHHVVQQGMNFTDRVSAMRTKKTHDVIPMSTCHALWECKSHAGHCESAAVFNLLHVSFIIIVCLVLPPVAQAFYARIVACPDLSQELQTDSWINLTKQDIFNMTFLVMILALS